MLEKQQGLLVSGIQEMYHQLLKSGAWNADQLNKDSGAPLTYNVLAALGLLSSRSDDSSEHAPFEEDCQKLQSRLIARGAGYVHKREPDSSDSEYGLKAHANPTSHSILFEPNCRSSKESYEFPVVALSPLTQSPVLSSKRLNYQLAQRMAPPSPRVVQ